MVGTSGLGVVYGSSVVDGGSGATEVPRVISCATTD